MGALAAALAAIDDTSLKSFFPMGVTADWPARAGYYVGLPVARDWARTMSLQQLAAMPREQVRQRSLATLRTIDSLARIKCLRARTAGRCHPARSAAGDLQAAPAPLNRSRRRRQKSPETPRRTRLTR